MFLYLIFALFLIEGIRIARRIIKEKEKEGGRPIKQKHFNGRFYW